MSLTVSVPLQTVNPSCYQLATAVATISGMDTEQSRQKRFGYRLRRLREATGLSMQDFSSRVAISYSHQRSLETGIRAPSTDLLERIADELGLTIDDLLRNEDIDSLVRIIEQQRGASLLYGSEEAAAEVENIQIFTSMMRDIDRLNLPEHVKQMIRDDVERVRRQARQ